VESPPLTLFNTLTQQTAEFVPLLDGEVGMYSCGPTVYAYQHIGNMRAYVFADTIKRVLRWKGLRVRHVMNITDVGHLTSDADEGEDKLEVAARREGRNAWEIAAFYTNTFKRDLQSLGILDPDVWCKATDHIQQMIEFASELEAAGWCYRLPSGLYFDTSKDRRYGELGRLDLEGQREGARVEVVEGKRNPSDFAVWRTSDPGERRQMAWDSPWGSGTPGWHLECSVMSIEYLGKHFDIHTGGVDHIPVHHTNEIAQSQAYLGQDTPWVAWWLHGEFINLKGAKLSKSTGGGILVTDLVASGYHPLVYRYLLLQAHYRSQLEFTWDAMEGARSALRRLLERFSSARSTAARELGPQARAHLDAFGEAISDDLNTARALAAVTVSSRDQRLSDGEINALARQFDQVLALGLTDLDPSDLDLRPSDASISDEEINRLLVGRDAAREAKDFTTSDSIRDRLTTSGIIVEDHPHRPSTWRWA
jgi:cysteinyl-tRNA synthetase